MAAAEHELERLVVRLIGDAESYQRMLAEAQTSTASGVANINSSLTAIKNIADTVGTAISAAFATIAISGVRSAAVFEQTQISFAAMIGDAEKSAKLLKDLTTLGAATPFEMPVLERATKMLLQYGTSAEKIVPILTAIGDVTGGTDPNRVLMMSYAFGQMSSTGRLMGQDLLQMINAGFNPLNEISKKTGQSIAELKKQMEKGGISAAMVTEAFLSGSKRLGLMEKQSTTLIGRWSTFSDNVGLLGRSIGEEVMPALKPMLEWMIFAVEKAGNWFKSLSDEGRRTFIILGGALAAVKLGAFINRLSGVIPILGHMRLVLTGLLPDLDGLTGKVGRAVTQNIAWRLGIIAVGAALSYGAVQLANYVSGLGQYNDKMNEANKRGAAYLQKYKQETEETVGKVQNMGTSAEKESALSAGLQAARKDLEGLRESFNRTQMVLAKNEGWMDRFAPSAALEQVNALQARRKDLIKATEDRITSLVAAMQGLSGVSAKEAADLSVLSKADLERLEVLKNTKKAYIDLVAAGQLRAKDIETTYKGIKAEITQIEDKARAILAEKAAAEKSEQVTKGLTAGLLEEMEAIGKTKHETLLLTAAKAGATQADMDNLKGVIDMVEARQKMYAEETAAKKAAQALEGSTQKVFDDQAAATDVLRESLRLRRELYPEEERALELRRQYASVGEDTSLMDFIAPQAEGNRRMAKDLKLITEAKQAVEDLTPPSEKYRKEKETLDEAMGRGVLTQGEYTAALEKLKQKYAETKKGADSLSRSIASLSGMAYGSAQHMAELRNLQIYAGSGPAPAVPSAPGARRSGFGPMTDAEKLANVDRLNRPSGWMDTAAQSAEQARRSADAYRRARQSPEAPLFTPDELGEFGKESPMSVDVSERVPGLGTGLGDGDVLDPLNRIAAIAEKYWGKGTNLSLTPAGLKS